MCGKEFSSSQVSELCAIMDETLKMFRTQPLTEGQSTEKIGQRKKGIV